MLLILTAWHIIGIHTGWVVRSGRCPKWNRRSDLLRSKTEADPSLFHWGHLPDRTTQPVCIPFIPYPWSLMKNNTLYAREITQHALTSMHSFPFNRPYVDAIICLCLQKHGDGDVTVALLWRHSDCKQSTWPRGTGPRHPVVMNDNRRHKICALFFRILWPSLYSTKEGGYGYKYCLGRILGQNYICTG